MYYNVRVNPLYDDVNLLLYVHGLLQRLERKRERDRAKEIQKEIDGFGINNGSGGGAKRERVNTWMGRRSVVARAGGEGEEDEKDDGKGLTFGRETTASATGSLHVLLVPRQPLENSLNPDHPLPGTSCCNSALT
jgi:hypothetical protein